MKKLFLAFLLLSNLYLLSGCAVIDFLDGKHLDHSRDYDRPTYGGTYGGGNRGGNGGGGHSH